MSADLTSLSAEAIATGVRRGALSARAVAEDCVARVRATDGTHGAFLELLAEEALERAGRIDERVALGEDPGPLAGVPVALKDNLCHAGHELTCGSRFLEGHVAPYSATAVERLLAAGAVILGRTNLDEFAMGSSTERSALGITRNPWDRERVPGGSSGGAAAAVAAGDVPLALGSDTGGSVRQPAAFCGLVGVKATRGRVSRHGLVAFASSLDQVGPLTRRVRDAALALRTIAGHDPRDATCVTAPVPDYLDGIEAGIEGLRVGVVRESETDVLRGGASWDWQESLERLGTLGARVVEVSVPWITGAVAAYHVLANAEASSNLARFDGVRYGRRRVAADYDSVVEASRSAGFGAEVKRRILLGTFVLSAGYREAYYERARRAAAALEAQMERALETVDLLAFPTAPGGAFRRGARTDDPLAMYLSDIFTIPPSLAGLPAVAVPSGRDDDGLPLSLQLVGPRLGEPTLLRAARAFEHATGWEVTPATKPAAGEGSAA